MAGRRGRTWLKVKPVHTVDLVVLAVERGHGRRTGLLSNLHLGARTAEGDFVMLGKTFKGLTDEMLRWQTERLGELAVEDDGFTVRVRPELVVEIAYDGLQRSTRYPAGSPSASPASCATAPTSGPPRPTPSRRSPVAAERSPRGLAGDRRARDAGDMARRAPARRTRVRRERPAAARR